MSRPKGFTLSVHTMSSENIRVIIHKAIIKGIKATGDDRYKSGDLVSYLKMINKEVYDESMEYLKSQ